jgi:hypothetical protein
MTCQQCQHIAALSEPPREGWGRFQQQYIDTLWRYHEDAATHDYRLITEETHRKKRHSRRKPPDE